jgi:beta-glucosidase
MRPAILLLTLTLICLNLPAQQKQLYFNGWIDFNKNGRKDIYEDRSKPLEARVNDLLSKMNLDEKTCQLATLYGYGRVLKEELPAESWKKEIWKDGIANMDEALNSLANNNKAKTKYSYPFSLHANAINTIQRWFVEQTRLGIPVDFSNEGIHGLCHDRATPLPSPISIGSTWNRLLVRKAGETVGREAKVLGYTNVYAPILDPARDPRWGRVVECYGEDPFLVAELGIQMTRGIQSEGVASTLKHFAVYSIPKGGRDGSARTDPHVAPKEMHQLYLYPFRRVITEAKPLGVMSSYNDWDGEPVTGSHYFLTELLRKEYGFNGYVVSDSRAVEFLHSKHHVATDFKDATRQSLEAGLNVWTNFSMPDEFIRNVRELVKEGRLPIAVVNQRVADVLRVKFRLGLFDAPYVPDESAVDQKVHTAADEQLALQLNRESLVLLKNEKQLLPLSSAAKKKILVTGPLAAAVNYATSRYGPSNNPVVSVLEGLKQVAGSETGFLYAEGCKVVNNNWPESEVMDTPLSKEEADSIRSAVDLAQQSDLIIAVLGEDEKCVGESLSRTSLDLPGRQEELLKQLYATGKPVVLILINGRPLTINWAAKNIPAILEAWFPGPQGGTAIAETIFGKYNPGGKLTMTFPKSIGQIEFNFPYKPGSHAGQSTTADPNGYGKTHVNGALYPFGHGLSYTSFQYSNLQVKRSAAEFPVKVSVDITNTGDMQGDEVVQLYVKDKVSSVTTYESQLRGFERITLAPHEKKTVQFELTRDDLALLNKQMKWVVEPGDFEVMAGSSSTDIRLRQDFYIR